MKASINNEMPKAVVPSASSGARCEGDVESRAPGRGIDGSWSAMFLGAHWIPVVVLVLAAVASMSFEIDQRFADWLYAWQGHQWRFRSSVVTNGLIHLVGRDLSTAAWLGVLATWIVTRLRPSLSAWRTPLACLLVSTLLATAVVAWIKSWSNMDCPWDIARYGGSRPYVGLLSLRPAGLPRAACFPAGHASAGYAWTALYFFFLSTRPQWRWVGLTFGIALGLLFGLTQQLRGAHFLSHDLWAAAICWTSAFGGYLLFQVRATSDSRPVSPIQGRVAIAPRAAASWLFRTGAK
jgi:membrane-associated PAP2 superfamily phosphatase